jgi:hypothetical protein
MLFVFCWSLGVWYAEMLAFSYTYFSLSPDSSDAVDLGQDAAFTILVHRRFSVLLSCITATLQTVNY